MVFAVLCMAGPGSFTAKDSTAKEAASLHLAWDASNDPAVVGYRVYYGDSSAKDSARYTKSVQVEGRLTCSAVISGLEDGKTYFFAVTAFTADGKESAYSPEITYKPVGPGADVDDHAGGTGERPAAPHAIPPPPRRVPGSAAKTSTAIPAGGPTAPAPPRRMPGPAATPQRQSRPAVPPPPGGGPSGGKRPPSSRISRPNSSPSPKAVRPPPPGGKIPPSRN